MKGSSCQLPKVRRSKSVHFGILRPTPVSSRGFLQVQTYIDVPVEQPFEQIQQVIKNTLLNQSLQAVKLRYFVEQ